MPEEKKPMASAKADQASKWVRSHRSTLTGIILLFAGALCLLGVFGIIEQLLNILPYVLLFSLGLILIYLGMRTLGYTKVTKPVDQKLAQLREKIFGKK